MPSRGIRERTSRDGVAQGGLTFSIFSTPWLLQEGEREQGELRSKGDGRHKGMGNQALCPICCLYTPLVEGSEEMVKGENPLFTLRIKVVTG